MPTENRPPEMLPRSSLWDRLPQVPMPTDDQLAASGQRLRARAVRRRLVRRGALALASALTLMAWLWASERAEPPLAPEQHQSASLHVPSASPVPTVEAPGTAAEPEVAAPQPTHAPAVVTRGVRPSRRSSPALPAPAVGAAPEPVASEDESTLLGQALVRLNREADPNGALALIDSFRKRFPNGELAGEAQLVRTRALLRLGRREELIAELTPEILAKLPRANELALLRAEALEQLGHCAPAAAELGALLESATLTPRLRARAMEDQARCATTSAPAAEDSEE